jgi:hypothetical protein
MQWAPGALSQGIKRQVPETDHSPPSSTEIRNCGAVPPLSTRHHDVVVNYSQRLLYFLYLVWNALLNNEQIMHVLCPRTKVGTRHALSGHCLVTHSKLNRKNKVKK